MLSLFLGIMLQLAEASDIGISEDVPPPPLTNKPQKSSRLRILEIQEGLSPEYLIPIKYSKHHKNVCRGKFYDENGEIYRTIEVFELLMKDKASRETMSDALDSLQLGTGMQYLGAATIWLYGIGIPIYAYGWYVYSKGIPQCKQAIIQYNSR